MKNAQSEGEGEEEEEEDEDEGGVGKTSENDHAGRGGVGTNILAQAACRWQCHPGSGRRDPALECQRGREESSIRPPRGANHGIRSVSVHGQGPTGGGASAVASGSEPG